MSDVRARRDAKESWELLGDLQANTASEVAAQRRSQRLDIRSAISAVPASHSHRTGDPVKGITGDVSSGGLQGLFARPLGVGDVYRITFDRKVLDTPPIFARCVRCRLIRDDAFEVGFAFFGEIDLEALPSHSQPSALV